MKRKLDPRTVLLITFTVTLSGLVINQPILAHGLLALCGICLLDVQALRECILYTAVYAVIAVLMYYTAYIPAASAALMLVSLSYFAQKFIVAMMMMEFLKRKTSMPYIISAMQTMKFPRIAAIPLIVVFRYMPTLKEDCRHLRDSLKIRGISASGAELFLHPIRSLEYFIVPILFRSLRIAEELSASVLLRGIENYEHRTNIYPLRFGVLDAVYAFSALTAVGTLCWMQFKQ